MWLLLRRRRKRIDDIDQYSSEDDSYKPKFAKPKKTADGEELPLSSPESSRRNFLSMFRSDKSPKDDSSDDYDPESQQQLRATDEFSSDTHDITPQDTDDSPEKAVDNSDGQKRRFFPSLFKKRKKKPDENEDISEGEQGISFYKEDNNYDEVENGTADGWEGIRMPHSNTNDENRMQYKAPHEVRIPRETESMAVQPDKQADDVPYETDSMVARPDNEKDYVNDFVFPRTYQQRPSSTIPRGTRRPASSNFDDDIKAVVQRGRAKTPMRSHSLDRTQANNYANKQFDRMRPRSYSQEPSRASNYNPRRHPGRGRSKERNGANDFARERNNQSRPQNDYSSREEQNRSRGRSTRRSDGRNFALKNSEQNGDPPGEVYADRLIRPTSLNRPRSSKFANNGSVGDSAGRKRSASMDRSGAGKFANNNSTGNKYSARRRSSSLDRSRANDFAHGTGAYPNKSYQTGPKNLNPPNNTPRDNAMVEKTPKAGVVITKKADGSIVHEVKRRREDGALVTTKTKYANIKLARKYGVPV